MSIRKCVGDRLGHLDLSLAGLAPNCLDRRVQGLANLFHLLVFGRGHLPTLSTRHDI